MGSTKRVFVLCKGISELVASIVILVYPEGYRWVVWALIVSLLLYSLKQLFYYFSMARYMVDGMGILYKGIFLMDLGIFALSLSNVPQRSVMLYLTIGLSLSGYLDIMESLDSKKLEGAWRYHFLYGLGKIAIAFMGIIFLGSTQIMSYIFCAGLIHSAISDIVSTFRKTAIIYIG